MIASQCSQTVKIMKDYMDVEPFKHVTSKTLYDFSEGAQEETWLCGHDGETGGKSTARQVSKFSCMLSLTIAV